MSRIGKSACDQCSYCTEFCPRYLLGYDVQPHKVMRSLGFTLAGSSNWNQWAELCCACGICTLYACPGSALSQRGVRRGQGQPEGRRHQVHAGEARVGAPDEGIPAYSAVDAAEAARPRGLGVRRAVSRAPSPSPAKVRIKLKQHAGVPATPIVGVGDAVRRGQPLARVGERELGATIHASIDGTVREMTKDAIDIWR